MKKILLVMFIVLFTAASVFCSEFEDTLKKAEGHADAQFELGLAYLDGRVVTQNFKLAYYVWLNLAAAQRHEKAIKNRDITAKKLTQHQLSEAQDLAAKIQYQIDNPAESQTQPRAKNDTGKSIGSGTGFFITGDDMF